MSPTRPLEFVALLCTQLLVGFAVGIVYFEALRRTVARFAARNGWLEPVALTVSRIGVAFAVFAIAARSGAAALLVTFVGFLMARTVALYWARKAR